ALPCCQHGGCWKSRTVPLRDGDEKDLPENLCVDVRHDLPRCMDMITSAEVIRRIETYFHGGALSFLTPAEARKAKTGISLNSSEPTMDPVPCAKKGKEAPERFEKADDLGAPWPREWRQARPAKAAKSLRK